MNLFFWMLLNLAVPIAGPVFTLALVAPAFGWRVARTMIAASVKDGQLFWCAIGLCAAAIYEAVTALEQGSRETSLLALGIVGFCGLAFACSIAVTAGLLRVRQDGSGAAIGDRQTGRVVGTFSRGVVAMSIISICLAATLSAALHIHLN
ncbi:hypothetical protein CI15_16100 [Paraburkholderia monticola]|jgi:hypothetical protein|uniref:Uncharacterized protein n=1 Tax=Paraburkholderia monticola TaxID=1399968 RepID=A0A149PRF5_9BURK|nr:hypothetical protein [Paraburkholderia monticola]KXU87651.1 hypothetical protein CI15_16100 [Paraburkholderia monticola]